MRILITGAGGFIASYLSAKLINEGHEVFCHIHSDGDLSQSDSLSRFGEIDHVFHLAAKTVISESLKNPYDFFQTNLMGTVTVLEFCRKNLCRLTFVSTYVYGEPKYLPIDELHPLAAATPYHKSKILCEELCEFYSEKFGVNVTVLRPFNVYGAGLGATFLIPSILSQILDPGLNEVSVQNLQARRDYIYVDDVAEAMVSTLTSSKTYAVYNVASGVASTAEDVIRNIMDITGITKSYTATGASIASNVSECVADISKIRSDLGFEPRYSLREGLSLMVTALKS